MLRRFATNRFTLPLTLAISLALGASSVQAITLDLADIVGGGDGTGTSVPGHGISVATGFPTTTGTGLIGNATNVYTLAANPLVDGVFIPDGGPMEAAVIQVSSTGLTVTGISDSLGFSGTNANHSFDHFKNEPGFSTTLVGASLGAHANKGITFDLDAIEAANGGVEATELDLSAASGALSTGPASFDFFVFVDGVLVADTTISSPNESIPLGPIALSPDDRFVTLITSSAGQINTNWSFWLDPFLTLANPVPAFGIWGSLLLAGILGIAGGRNAMNATKMRD